MIRRLALYVLALLIGLVLGVGSAIWVLRLGPALGEVSVAGWTGTFSAGSARADPYTRAVVAARGLLAATTDEAVYLNRTLDDQGTPLSERCDYEVRGGAMPAQWWSLTVYARNDFLPPNADDALSLDATRAGGGAFSLRLSAVRPDAGAPWISTKAAGEGFTLMLRLYRPSSAFLGDPGAYLTPPTIRRLTCRGGV
ncbi:MAG: DUF1214 domain-containing protein [Caulobacterales bacterium]